MTQRPETSFEDIEGAKQSVKLLIKAIEESRRDVVIALAEGSRSERSKKALQLLTSDNQAKLSQHMTSSRRILNHLRTFHRLLLQEWRVDNTLQRKNGNPELNRWSQSKEVALFVPLFLENPFHTIDRLQSQVLFVQSVIGTVDRDQLTLSGETLLKK